MAEARAEAGREEAIELALQTLALAREHEERGNEGWVLRILAEVTSDGDSMDVAEQHFRLALALGEDLDMRPLVVAHCHLGLGRLYRRTDKPAQAQEHLATATTMYRDMEMQFWLDQAEAESKELR